MKAIVYHKYCLPDIFEYGDIDKPVPWDDEMLVHLSETAEAMRDLAECHTRRK